MSNVGTDKYYASGQYDQDPRRRIAWREIIRFLKKFIPGNSIIVDLGAGYCDFINQVAASKKYAVDYSPDLSKFAAPEVSQINGPASDLSKIETGSVDVVHSSNLFEHFSDEELDKTMGEVGRVLKKGGRLILIQPNFRLQPGRYFDDHTHKKIFNDSSLESFVVSHDFKTLLKMPRFLPQEVKHSPSLLPNFLLPLIIRAYIHSPLKPLAGQMLYIAEKI